MTNGTMMEALWASFGYHWVLWLGLLVVIGIFAVALVRDCRKDRPPHDTLERRPRP